MLSSLVGGFYYGDVMAGIDAVATRRGTGVVAVQQAEPWAYDRMNPAPLLPIAQDHMDGFIVIADSLTEEGLQALVAGGKPIVTVSAHNPVPLFPSVVPDNRGGAATAVRHLLAHGHRRIAFMGWLEQEDPLERYEGYRAALLGAGISPDSELFFAASDCIEEGGRVAATAMLAAGMPCTAILAATDANAIGALEVLQKAGCRVPDDMAIIGFDDIDLAQYSTPPLTSVRQTFSALGVAAAEQLLALLAGESASGGVVLVPTTFVCRRSCGCAGDGSMARDRLQGMPRTDWPAWLADQLAAQLLWPRHPDRLTSAEQLWPGVGAIAEAFDGALRGAGPLDTARLDEAWRQGCTATASTDTLHSLLLTIEQAGEARLEQGDIADEGAPDRLAAFLEQSRLSVLRSAMFAGTRARRTHETTMHRAYDVSVALARSSGSTGDLEWARLAALRRCCLALWREGTRGGERRLEIRAVLGDDGAAAAAVGKRVAVQAFPPAEFLEACVERSMPQTVSVFPLGTREKQWGYLAVVFPAGGQFREAHDSLRQWLAQLTVVLEREALGLLADQQRQAAQQREQYFRALVEHATDLMLIVGAEETVTYASPSHEALLGISAQRLLGTHLAAWLHPDDAEHLTAALAGAGRYGGSFVVGEVRMQHADGSWRILEVKANDRSSDPAIRGIILNSRDITERKQIEEALQHQAMHDVLTGMPNRALFGDRIEQALRVARREQTSLAMCLLDLDRFKEVNDAFGHGFGDLVLKVVAERLRAAVRAPDTIARLGGDEFAIILPDANEQTAVDIAARIGRALQKPIEIEGHCPTMAASIGIALYPLHGDDAATLVAHADVAMYAAKHAGSGHALYDIVLDEHNPDYLALPQEFMHALNTGGLHLYYQPLIDLGTKQVATVEALLRWHHPRHGFIPPARFLPLAERIGAGIPLTRWVLDTAVRQCAEWRRKGLGLRVAVNISARLLQSPELATMVFAALREHGVPPYCLTLEIVENALMADLEHTLDVLTTLSAAGVHIAIDDFGTGFSSLAFLKQLPVDEIKIDRSFVSTMAPGRRDEALVHSIIDLSHSLGLAVVAEGIEDEITLGRLAELGCDIGQGFHMSHPVPAAELERWVTTAPWQGSVSGPIDEMGL